MHHTIALFGEAEKGEFSSLHHINTLDHLSDLLGNPPDDTKGLYLAVQSILFSYDLIYIRVKDEGFSTRDYLSGLKQLRKLSSPIMAIGLPGVGDDLIIEAGAEVCSLHKSMLLTTEQDLYDYLTLK